VGKCVWKKNPPSRHERGYGGNGQWEAKRRDDLIIEKWQTRRGEEKRNGEASRRKKGARAKGLGKKGKRPKHGTNGTKEEKKG